MSALEQLWMSTADLYDRFGLDAKSIPPSKRRRIFMEEVTEVIEASVGEENAQGEWQGTVVDLEAVDVLVTVIGLLQAHDIPLEQFLSAVEMVVQKNNAKTHDTHALINGKITRKAVAS